MIQFVLEVIAFQLAFLMVYDLFLKKETFFQWNRGYLLVSFLLSFILPWIKVEALKTTVPATVFSYPEFFIALDGVSGEVAPTQEPALWELLTWYEWLYSAGVLVMGLWLSLKLFRIAQLRKRGSVRYYPQFTKITVPKSDVAFSFFKQVFLGDGVQKEKEPQIVSHELVHIRQWHSLDLVFFELMRILFWCNPLVYIYQSRMTDLHEFIADSQVAKESKKDQYEALLSQAFQTENISFVNSFFRSSLLKKRLLMLGKEKSKAIFQLKYLLLLPLVLGMLLYSSCEREVTIDRPFVGIEVDATASDEELITTILSEMNGKTDANILIQGYSRIVELDNSKSHILSKMDFFRKNIFFKEVLLRANSEASLSEKTREFINDLPYPSSEDYSVYVERKKAFQALDENLQVSIPQKDFVLQEIQPLEKYPDDYEVIKVSSVTKFSGAEIRVLNQTIEKNKHVSNLALVLTDGTNAYLVSKKNVVVLDENHVSSGTDSSKTQESVLIQTTVPFSLVDAVPIFPGCENASDKKACFQDRMIAHIKKNFNYPLEAQELGVQGRVSIVFVVDMDGSISNIRKRGPHPLLDNAAVRIIEKLPRMIPGEHEGEKVQVPFSIPITFRLPKAAEKTNQFSLRKDEKDVDQETKNTIARYNQLVTERERLLRASNENNPVLVNLSKQIEKLRLLLKEQLGESDL